MKPKTLFRAFLAVIKDKNVFVYGFSTLCAFGCAVAYMVSAPFIFLNTLGLSIIEFGWLAGLITASYLAGGIINNQLTKKLALDTIILIAFLCMLLAAVSISISLLFWETNFWVMVVNVFILMLASRMVFPNALAGAFSSSQQETGVISSVYGLYHTLGAVIASGLIGLISLNPAIGMALVMTGLSSLGLLIFCLCQRQNTA